MKFPRNARIFQGLPDAAPMASVFFLLVILLMFGGMVYTPGVSLQLPVSDDLPGIDKPCVTVAVDPAGRLYYENQSVQETELLRKLKGVVRSSPERLVLVVQADKRASAQALVRLASLARKAGITEARLATLPGPFAKPL